MTVNHWVPGSSPGRGAKFENPAIQPGFLLPADSHRDCVPGYSPRLTPPGPLLARVQLRCRVLVAEPNSRTRPSSRVFYCLRTLTGTASQVIRQGSPLRGRCLRAFSCAVESWSRSQIREPGHPAGFFIFACRTTLGLWEGL